MESKQSKEHPSTYFVQDRTNTEERNRVQLQDTLITKAMGGVLPEQKDQISLRRVIDVGCGTGGWLVEMAKTYPDISLLVGVDVNNNMIQYARDLAQEEQVDDRVEFHVMDTLRMIEFPRRYFDLVNQRLGWSYLRTWDWPNVLNKYQYVTRPGGIIRVTESYIGSTSTSPALMQLNKIVREALYNAGHLFTHTRDGVTNKLPEIFIKHGIKDIQTRTSLVEYLPGTETMAGFRDDIAIFFRTIVPFVRKWGNVPDNYDDIYHQALHQIQQPGSITTWEIVTIWGTNT